MYGQMQLIEAQTPATRESVAVKFALDLTKQNNTSPKVEGDVNTRNISSLNAIFPSKAEENNLQRARRMLAGIASTLKDEELETFLTEFECLIDSWLDEFERKIFDKKTLLELLKEG